MTKALRIAGLLLATMSLSACGLFGDKEVEAEPKELVKLDNTLNIKRLGIRCWE